ncbi:hypothetical protein Y032_0467g1992 [Ancylostoma ceylanicum]|uniref:HTH CENPB-type domain-containing protein n=1 Tax=Ancylostoma ceylanicum TaxID=53326 RepID=A0A016WWP2_9BILA|nr:hypothetical protein Y032_0467g1992 [Ancylostoma ceylanicum]
MQDIASSSDQNPPIGSQRRKRRTRVECQNAIQLLAKALKIESESDASTSVNGDQIAESAFQLFSKKNVSAGSGITSDTRGSTPTPEEQEREELPSINDPSAIQDFFWKNRSRKLRDFVSVRRPHEIDGQGDSSIPSDHPMRKILEHSDKDMSVKEALAKEFRNYKVRLPKKRIQFSVDPTIDPSVLYSLFANDSVDENSIVTPSTPSVTTVRDALTALANVSDAAGASSTASTTSETDTVKMIKAEPGDSLNESNTLIKIGPASYNIDKAHQSVYSLPPFWKLPLIVSKGYRGIYYVQGIRYVQLTTLMKDGALAVPLDVPMGFDLEGQVATFTLNDLLLANGIAINDPKDCKELCRILTPSVFLIQHAIADHLLWNCGPNPLNPLATLCLEHYLISISRDLPPFACHKLQYFELGLNGWYGHNEVFDPCTPGPHSPPASASSFVSEDVKPAVELPAISLSARQKGLVVTSFDTGASIEELSLKFGVPTEAIESIILNRAEVIRDQTAALMAETEDERDKQLLQSARKKNRVRRTSFVGLNILMWRFFKDCRDNGIVLNGKLLKEHAMMISRQLGLENFKGSEGWLDAFKRRHKIDLKNMSGVPVNYEETDDDKMEEDHDDATMASASTSSEPVAIPHEINISQIQSSSEGTTAALLDCVEKASAAAPGAVASISSTKPLDLGNLFSNTNGAAVEPSPNCSKNMVNGVGHAHPVRLPSQLSITPSSSLDENGFIAAVVKSAAISVHDKELSSALETIRSYILANDASAMPAFLELQMKLAVISREQNKRGKQAQMSNYLDDISSAAPNGS